VAGVETPFVVSAAARAEGAADGVATVVGVGVGVYVAVNGTVYDWLPLTCRRGGPLLAQEWMSMIIPVAPAAATTERRRQ
jgi:hypothetical protein